MNVKSMAIYAFLLAGAALLSAQAPTAAPLQSPLHRQYREGEQLAYRMTGVNEDWHYTINASGQVKRDPSGAYFEEYTWSDLKSGGQPTALSPQTAGFRQRLSLDPDQNPSMPDLSKVDPKIIGPITDFMTFSSDLWIAIKTGQLKRAGDHFYMPYGVPSSWADGTYVRLGQSSIDFDMTWKKTDAAGKTAELEIRHVPPAKSMIMLPVTLPVAWMQAPVGDKPNNWVTVQKSQDGKLQAAVGEETFDVDLTVSLTDGKILAGSMDNIVKTIQRTCDDDALTHCTDPVPHEIHRKIEIVLVQ
jgi:hypothetical protein